MLILLPVVDGLRVGTAEDEDSVWQSNKTIKGRLGHNHHNWALGEVGSHPLRMKSTSEPCPTRIGEKGLCQFSDLSEDLEHVFSDSEQNPSEDLQRLRQMLATAAWDIYAPVTRLGNGEYLEMNRCLGRHRRSEYDFDYAKMEYRTIDPRVDRPIRVGLYTIKEGPLQGRKILAIRGTKNANDWLSKNLNIAGGNAAEREIITNEDGSAVGAKPKGSSNFERTIQYIEKVVDDLQLTSKDFVTGHSLGGALAETVALRKGLNGASWNAPATCSPENVMNWCTTKDVIQEGRTKPKFEVWATETDVVVFAGSRTLSDLPLLSSNPAGPVAAAAGGVLSSIAVVGNAAYQAGETLAHPMQSIRNIMGGKTEVLPRLRNQVDDVFSKVNLASIASTWAYQVHKNKDKTQLEEFEFNKMPGRDFGRKDYLDQSHIGKPHWVRCTDRTSFVKSMHSMDCMISQQQIGGPLPGVPMSEVKFGKPPNIREWTEVKLTPEQNKKVAQMRTDREFECPVDNSATEKHFEETDIEKAAAACCRIVKAGATAALGAAPIPIGGANCRVC